MNIFVVFLPPFGCDLVRPPYVVIDSNLFSITFNLIIMTWNKWLVFTKSVIIGLNNISPWPCPLGFVCLPCVITWLYSTPWLFVRSVGVVVCLSLCMAKVPGSRRTQYSVVSVIFIAFIVLYFLRSFFHAMTNIYQFSFHIDILI